MSESARKVGRKEILTEGLARSICRMIERMPDAGIPITWGTVMAHAKRRFDHGFNRQMLSQKRWNGRKLIAEAFNEAKSIQRRMRKDAAPKYKTGSRSVLQGRIAALEAKVLTLQEELEGVRAKQVHALDTFLNTQLDLRELIQNSVSEV